MAPALAAHVTHDPAERSMPGSKLSAFSSPPLPLAPEQANTQTAQTNAMSVKGSPRTFETIMMLHSAPAAVPACWASAMSAPTARAGCGGGAVGRLLESGF